jgi:hypothetical protein
VGQISVGDLGQFYTGLYTWSVEAPGLGRPRTVRAVRVPRIVLDVCMGRLMPHRRHPALIERYVTRPPVTLYDLGAYGLSWARIHTPTPALTSLGLSSPTGLLPPPSCEALLARISQRPLFDADPEAPSLSLLGLQRVGLLGAPPAPEPEAPPLFFVAPNMIGDMIGNMITPMIGDMITPMDTSEGPPSTPGREETPQLIVTSATTGNLPNQASAANEPSSPATTADRSRSGEVPNKTTDEPAAQSAQRCAPPPAHIVPPATVISAAPEERTPAEQRLLELGVYPSVSRRYRELPLALVERAYTIALRLPERRNLAATIVHLLREGDAQAGWLAQGRADLFLAPMDEANLLRAPAPDVGAQCLDTDTADPQARIYALLCAQLEPRIYLFIEHQQITLSAEDVSVEVPTWFSRDERAAVSAGLSAVAAQLGLRAVLPTAEPVTPDPAPVSMAQAPVIVSDARRDHLVGTSPVQWGQDLAP